MSKTLKYFAVNGGRDCESGGRWSNEYGYHEPQDASNGRSCVLWVSEASINVWYTNENALKIIKVLISFKSCDWP